MKKTIIITLVSLLISLGAQAKSDPAEIRFKVTTYDTQGALLHTGYGLFLQSGEGLAPYRLFEGASRAEVTDSRGKTWQVERICGASDLYDVVRFTTTCTSAPAATLLQGRAAQGTLLTLSDTAGAQLSATISAAEEYNGVVYYTLALPANNDLEGSPLCDASGRLVAMLQASSAKDRDRSFALSATVAGQLEINAMSAGNAALNAIKMPKQLPADKEQAASYVYLLSKNLQDDAIILTALQDYIALFPAEAGGYADLALYHAARANYQAADQAYTAGWKKVANAAELHYNLSKLIYNLNFSTGYDTYSDWTLERALAEAEQALNTDPSNTLYLLQAGDCRFALKQYQASYDAYQTINATTPSAETYYRAARAREQVDGDTTAILALLDSAVARFTEPYASDAGPYIFQRAQYLTKFGRYRLAAMDYKTYEDLIGTKKLNDSFFYAKEQVDFHARLFQWALEDIDKALAVAPDDYIYLVEKALVQIRCGQFDEAVLTAQRAIGVEPQGADAYKMLGIAYGESGDRANALSQLRRAQELGDPQAESLIEELLGE